MPTDHLAEGEQHLKDRNVQSALRSFQRYAAENPQDPTGHMKVGHCFKISRQNEDAVANYGKAIALDPKNVEALLNCGDANVLLGRLDDAVGLFEKVVALTKVESPQFAAAAKAKEHDCRAKLESRQGTACLKGNPASALKHFETAIAFSPGAARYYTNAGIACLELGRALDGLGYFKKAVELEPDGEDAQDAKGRLAACADGISKARSALPGNE